MRSICRRSSRDLRLVGRRVVARVLHGAVELRPHRPRRRHAVAAGRRGQPEPLRRARRDDVVEPVRRGAHLPRVGAVGRHPPQRQLRPVEEEAVRVGEEERLDVVGAVRAGREEVLLAPGAGHHVDDRLQRARAGVLLLQPVEERRAALVEAVVAPAEAAERLAVGGRERVGHRDDAVAGRHARRDAEQPRPRARADDQLDLAPRVARPRHDPRGVALHGHRLDVVRRVLHAALDAGQQVAVVLVERVLDAALHADGEREGRVQRRAAPDVLRAERLRVGRRRDRERPAALVGDLAQHGPAARIEERDPQRRALDHRARAAARHHDAIGLHAHVGRRRGGGEEGQHQRERGGAAHGARS